MKYTLNLEDGSTATMEIIDPNTDIEQELTKMNYEVGKRLNSNTYQYIPIIAYSQNN